MSKRDFYEVLGVDRSATDGDIKQAYRNMARKYHPDICKDVEKKEAEDRFKEINEAYEVLGDQKKRSAYDQFGHDGIRGAASGGYGDMGDFGFGGFGGFDDLFNVFFGSGGPGGGARSKSQPQRGNDLRSDTTLTLEEVLKGVEKEVNVSALRTCSECFGTGTKDGSTQTCSQCQGTGQERTVQNTMFGRFIRSGPCRACKGEGTIITSPCHECNGSGRVNKKRKVTVNIPPGVDEGSRIRIPGEGEAGIKGGPAGDLYVFVSLKRHKTFKRLGDDLYLEQDISFPRAALGGKITIPTLEGNTELEIPSGTQSETIFRVKNHGLPGLRSGKRGDLQVKVIVKVPGKLNSEQKKLLHEFAKASGEELEGTHTEKGILDRVKNALGV